MLLGEPVVKDSRELVPVQVSQQTRGGRELLTEVGNRQTHDAAHPLRINLGVAAVVERRHDPIRIDVNPRVAALVGPSLDGASTGRRVP